MSEEQADLESEHEEELEEQEESSEGESPEGEEESQQEKTKEEDKASEDEKSVYLDFDKPESLTPERVRARINAETRIKGQQDKKIRELEEKLQAIEREKHEMAKPKEVKPPSTDLAYENEAEFKRQNEAYAEHVRKQAEWEYQQTELERKAEQAKALAQQQQAQSFIEKGEKHGISEQEVRFSAQMFGNLLHTHAKSDADRERFNEIENFILDHDYGPRLISDLSKDFDAVKELSGMTPTRAAVALHERARAYQQSLKSKAPPPDDPLRGNGAPPNERGPKGATYE